MGDSDICLRLGLGLGSVFTLIFAPQGTCVSLGGSCLPPPPTFALSFPKGPPEGSERSELSLKGKIQKGREGNKERKRSSQK